MLPPRTDGADRFLGNGDGTFNIGVTYKSGTGGVGTSVPVADVGDDGAADLVATEQCAAQPLQSRSHRRAARLARSRSRWSLVLRGFLTNSFEVADLNGDGGPDLVIANHQHVCPKCHRVCLPQTSSALMPLNFPTSNDRLGSP